MSYQEVSCKNVRGRDIYSCSWCGEKIEKGVLHQNRYYKFEGLMTSSREHLECAEAMNTAHKNEVDLEYGWMPGKFKRCTCESKY